MKTKQREISALAGWYGSNRTLAHEVGEELAGCDWTGVVFAGGMSELAHIKGPKLVNDLHRDIINLARVVADDNARSWLVVEAGGLPFHPDILAKAQEICKANPCPVEADAVRALHYFVTCWMGRGAQAGTDGEFNGGLSIRWKNGGGDSNVRYRSAIESLESWGKIMRECCFTCMDAFDFLAECKKRDIPKNGIYVDSDWPDDGKIYKHSVGDDGHERLRDVLESFERARIVIRYGDHDLIRALYPESKWNWRLRDSRTQANKAKREALITRRAS